MDAFAAPTLASTVVGQAAYDPPIQRSTSTRRYNPLEEETDLQRNISISSIRSEPAQGPSDEFGEEQEHKPTPFSIQRCASPPPHTDISYEPDPLKDDDDKTILDHSEMDQETLLGHAPEPISEQSHLLVQKTQNNVPKPIVGPPLDSLTFGRVAHSLDIEINNLSTRFGQLTAFRHQLVEADVEKEVEDLKNTETYTLLKDMLQLCITTRNILEGLPGRIKSLDSKVVLLKGKPGSSHATKDESEEARNRVIHIMRCFTSSIESLSAQEWQEKKHLDECRVRMMKRIQLTNSNFSGKDWVVLLRNVETEAVLPLDSATLASFETRWALENPFTQLRKVLDEQDLELFKMSLNKSDRMSMLSEKSDEFVGSVRTKLYQRFSVYSQDYVPLGLDDYDPPSDDEYGRSHERKKIRIRSALFILLLVIIVGASILVICLISAKSTSSASEDQTQVPPPSLSFQQSPTIS